MVKEIIYVKSFEEDLVLKTLKGKKKVRFQTMDDIVKTKTIKLNTNSFGRKKRLACTIIHKNYLKTYRPQGLIFKTKQKPNHVTPFDLVLLTDTDKIIVQYYRIKDSLHEYYNNKLIKGHKKFIFKTIDTLIKRYSTPEKVWQEVNKFRMAHGRKQLEKQKYRLVEYNEAMFTKNVKITPVAIFGYRKNSREKAKKLGLPHYISTRKFYERVMENEK